MAKLFKTSEDIVKMAEEKFEKTGLDNVGVNLKVISLTKANEVFKVAKANATTEFLTKNSDMVTLFVYEDAFDRLTDDEKSKLMDGALSNISFDYDKDRINVDTSRYGELIRMRRVYPDYGDVIETSIILIEEIAEEEKRKKEEEKARKAEERAAKKK